MKLKTFVTFLLFLVLYLPTVAQDIPISVSDSILDFGNVKTGEETVRSFYIVNNSSNAQTIQDFSNTHPDFTFSWTGGSLSSNERRKVDVTYAPSSTTNDVGAWVVIGTNEMYESSTCLKVTFKASSIDESKLKCSHLVVQMKDKSKVSFGLQDEPVMGYKNGKLVITCAGSVTEFDVSNVLKLSYVDIPNENDIEEHELSDRQGDTPFIQNDESLTFFPGVKDLSVQISTVGGATVRSFIIPKDHPATISLTSLHPGVYIIRVNEITYKTIIR